MRIFLTTEKNDKLTTKESYKVFIEKLFNCNAEIISGNFESKTVFQHQYYPSKEQYLLFETFKLSKDSQRQFLKKKNTPHEIYSFLEEKTDNKKQFHQELTGYSFLIVNSEVAIVLNKSVLFTSKSSSLLKSIF